MFVTYLTIYDGDKLPPFYIGSSTEKRISAGYRGSVKSKVYSKLWQEELENHPELFDIVILDKFKTRKEALVEELRLHNLHDVRKNDQFVNMAYASVNGHHGRDVAGEKHPLYGSHNCKGYFHSHDPKTGKAFFKDYLPDGAVIGRINQKPVNKGKRYWVNGDIVKISNDCPGDGFVLGSNDARRKHLANLSKTNWRKGPAWEFYDELKKLWDKSDIELSPYMFRKKAVSLGFPDQAYGAMISKFKEDDYENSISR